MGKIRRPASRGGRGWFWSALALVACSPEYQLLRSNPGSSEGGFSGNPVVGPSAGAGGSGLTSMLGGTGGASGTGGGVLNVGGAAGMAVGGSANGGSDGQHCSSLAMCPFGALCVSYTCVPCAAAPIVCPVCDHGFAGFSFNRNGCNVCECVPLNECGSDADCSSGELCYPGQQCEDGCSEPSCCFGNQCSLPGCEAPPASACLEVGCAGGEVCLAACDSVDCECDGAAWQCVGTTQGTADDCPQACAPP